MACLVMDKFKDNQLRPLYMFVLVPYLPAERGGESKTEGGEREREGRKREEREGGESWGREREGEREEREGGDKRERGEK